MKAVPVRTCIACRLEKPKRELVRVVKTPEGEIRLDLSGKLAGRGAYVCNDAACIRKLGQKKLLARAFSMPVESEIYARIEEEFLGGQN